MQFADVFVLGVFGRWLVVFTVCLLCLAFACGVWGALSSLRKSCCLVVTRYAAMAYTAVVFAVGSRA